MKLNKIAARFMSVIAVAAFAFTAAVPAFAEAEPYQTEELLEEDIEEEIEDTEGEDPGIDSEPEEVAQTEAPLETEATTEDTEAPTTQPPETTAAELPTPTYIPDEKTMYAPEVLNVRRGPSTDYDKLGVVYANSAVQVLGVSGEWSAISYNNGIGYILSSLLTDTEPITTTTTAAPETVQSEEIPTETESVPAETEPDIAVPEETEETTMLPELIPEETTQTTAAAVTAADNKTDGGLPAILIALISAIGVFCLVGPLPILIHKINHRNLYRY